MALDLLVNMLFFGHQMKLHHVVLIIFNFLVIYPSFLKPIIILELKNRNWKNERIAKELGMDQEEEFLTISKNRKPFA